jgi:hypothetical protein
MRLARLSLAVLFALTVLATAQAQSPPQNAPQKQDNKKKPPPKLDRFDGMVMAVKPNGNGTVGSFAVKHANGTGKWFQVTSSTKIGGVANITSFKGMLKGQLVQVMSTKGNAVQVKITRQAPPTTVLKPKGPPFKGTVVKVQTDQYGDTGKLWVRDAKGAVIEFRVNNATTIDYKIAGKTHLHTLQGVVKGQTVLVKHANKIAVHIDVLMEAKKP